MDLEDSSSSNSHSPPHVPPVPTFKRKAGRKKFKETRHPIYRGVRQRNGEKWVCEVRDPHTKSRIWLGTFPSPDMAARAYDVAAIALRGVSAPLNFPDSAWVLPRARSSLAADIQVAAATAAEAFRPTTRGAAASSSSSTTSNDVSCIESPKKVPEPSMGYVDEDALFNMPGILNDMAEGLLLPPPSMQKDFNFEEEDCHVDFTLWSD
ncbi:dehydration-responsive element-binding protein 1F-like [Magnolia sinica]|uniref:dehydration-responsive element-binding protein 1F-like n=1 Tax=Magnolia sinica TaxID=86752 RepID=UPI00265A2637|nr:dehydration-responsive element-binding protein 1F-like [Magnolia sinica]